ncbi:VOC family protein [Roseitalea porphyridii]|uniref:Glyoxalase/bleomycin resistance/extradiol dioxygenase family protein n=1 Tax=Roseitalea porphyridii TaxID=1852022 RepID=A0A4P6UWC6_9HYPH|nr:VOC family protein [Roseitalea porphyridii]QBK29392.1 glyoxalase/bleomycin resistance/extradiol dioxygenase family protein [Roseitalea porphyridii]
MQPDGILETALYADDLAAAKAFYGTVIGLTVITEVAGRHVFFRCGDGVLLLFDPAATAQPPSDPSMPVPPHGAHGPGHACFRVAGDALDGWRDHLEEAGIAIEADFRWPNGARSLYFRDPAGNSLEISEPKLWGLA